MGLEIDTKRRQGYPVALICISAPPNSAVFSSLFYHSAGWRRGRWRVFKGRKGLDSRGSLEKKTQPWVRLKFGNIIKDSWELPRYLRGFKMKNALLKKKKRAIMQGRQWWYGKYLKRREERTGEKWREDILSNKTEEKRRTKSCSILLVWESICFLYITVQSSQSFRKGDL